MNLDRIYATGLKIYLYFGNIYLLGGKQMLKINWIIGEIYLIWGQIYVNLLEIYRHQVQFYAGFYKVHVEPCIRYL